MATTNLHSIDNIEINGMDFKHLETTKDIVITLKNKYGRPAWPDTTHKWTAKVSDGTNYVGDYAVKINATNMIIDSEDFTKLPVGNYQLEVWEQWTDADGASQLSIYPSPKQTIPFNIYANIPDQAGKEIKEIGFQDVVNSAVTAAGLNLTIGTTTTLPAGSQARVEQNLVDGKNQFSFYIPVGEQGDKGDPGKSAYQVWLDLGNTGTEQDFINTLKGPQGNPGTPGKDGESAYQVWLDLGNKGTEQDFINSLKGPQGDTGSVDNAGLTSAPAFQALQTQVNNSAVGTNLVKDSGQEFTSKGYTVHTYNLASLTALTPGKTYTMSFSVKVDDKAVNCQQHIFVDIFNPSWGWDAKADVSISTDYQRVTQTFTVPEGITDANCIGVYLSHPIINGKSDPSSDKSDVAGTGYIKELMLEKGTVAHDWSPAPSEILTQSDYAKIKAAIVALGGSLS